MTDRTPTIGLIAGGGFQGIPYLELTHCIPGATSIVLDLHLHNVNSALADIYVKMPPLKDIEAFETKLHDAINRYNISFIFPVTQIEQHLLTKIREQWNDATYVVSSTAVLSICFDKKRLVEWLLHESFPTLRAESPVDSTIQLIGKPREGWGGRGIVYLSPGEQPSDALSTDEYLWQRNISGFREISIDTGVSLTGSVIQPILRERIRVSGGFAVVSRIISHVEIENCVRAFVSRFADLGALGPLNVQVLLESNGQFWISDVNPRLGTSAVTAAELDRNILSEIIYPNSNGKNKKTDPLYIFRTLTTHNISTLATPPKGVVFDLDDTLLDQKKWIRSKLKLIENYVISEFDIDRNKYRFVVEMLVNEGPWKTLIDELINEMGLPPSVAPHLISAYKTAIPSQAPLYRDVIPILCQLRRADIKLGILSDNPSSSQMQKLSASPLPSLVEAIVLTDELAQPKPHRAGFETVAKAMDVPASQLVMVGNSMTRDIAGAIDAGFRHATLIERKGAMFSTSKETIRFLQSNFPDGSFSKIPQLSFLRTMFNI